MCRILFLPANPTDVRNRLWFAGMTTTAIGVVTIFDLLVDAMNEASHVILRERGDLKLSKRSLDLGSG